MNLSPFTVRENTPLLRIYSLFRGLGLRHLMVTNAENEIVGIITATELDEHHLEHKIQHIIPEHSHNDEEKRKFATERMSFLRGDDNDDDFYDNTLHSIDLANTQRVDFNLDKKIR